MTIQNARMEAIYNNKSQLVNKSDTYDCNSSRMSDSRDSNFGNRIRFNKSEVSPNVGALERRDYTIRKPVLKVGSNNYVDTYSVF